MLPVLARVTGRPERYVDALRMRLQRSMPPPSSVLVKPVAGDVDPRMHTWTAGSRISLAFGALALIVAALGLYAAVTFAVAQRTQEIGIRIALGARAAGVIFLILRQGAFVTFIGVLIGVGVAFDVANALDSVMYKVSPADPAIYGAVAATLIVVGILAAVVPAGCAPPASTPPPPSVRNNRTLIERTDSAACRHPRQAHGMALRDFYSIGPPFLVCGTPSVIHFGAGVPLR